MNPVVHALVDPDLGKGADALVGATTTVVVGGLAILDQPRLQQRFEQPGLHRFVSILLDGEALVLPPEVGDPQGHMTPGMGGEVKRTLFAVFFCLFTADGNTGVGLGLTVRRIWCGLLIHVIFFSEPIIQFELILQPLHLLLQIFNSLQQLVRHCACKGQTWGMSHL